MRSSGTLRSLLAPGLAGVSRKRLWLAYSLAVVLPLLTVFIHVGVVGYKVGDPPSLILFLLPVIVTAYIGGAWPGLAATTLSTLLCDYFILPPLQTLLIANHLHFTQWATLVGGGVLVSVLTEALHRSRHRVEMHQVEQLVTLSSIGDAVITSDATGRITFVNPAAEKLTGWTNSEAIGQDLSAVFRIVSEDTGEAVEDPVHKVLRLGAAATLASHTILHARDGGSIPVEDSGAPIKAPDGSLRGVVLVFRDATEVRRSEKALLDQINLRSQLASIAETAPGVIHSFRLRPDGSMCFPYASPRIVDIYGLRPEEIATDASPVFALMHPDDAAHVRASVAESTRTMKLWHDEFRLRHPQRGEIWVEGRSTPRREPDGSILWQGFLTDVTERRKAEELMLQNDRQLRLVTDSMPALVAYVDKEYRYRFVNKKYEEWFRRPQQEICGKTIAEVMGDEVYTAIKDKLDRALSGEQVAFENTQDFKTQGHRTLQATYVPDVGAGGKVNGLYVLVLDITARKKIEEELREKDSVLREAMKAAHLVAWELDLVTESLKETGPASEMFFRTKPEPDLTLALWIEDIHPEDLEPVEKRLRAALAGEQTYSVEFRTRPGPAGQLHWVQSIGEVERDKFGKPVRVHGIAMDITERKVAEEALRTSRTQLRAALDAGGMGIWVTDLRTNRIWLDDTSLALWGLPEGSGHEFDVELVRARVHPDDAARVKELRDAVLREGKEWSTEFRILHPNGRTVWLASKGRVERDAAGALVRQVGILTDVTERKGTEEARIRSQKLEALGTLSGGIAHDFNNILLAINENARLASEEVPPDHTAQENISEIRKAGRRAADLVRQILAFSRPREKEKQVLELAPVVEEALKLVRATIPANIRFEKQVVGKLPLVAADSGQIYQIMVNLATNAAHAIGSKPGLIQIRMEPYSVAAGHSGQPGLSEGNYLMLSVSDNGSGMDMATLDRIFDPFFTTKGPGQGTGLGLSMVHGIMKDHNGAISVNSKPGEGTVFHLYFPAAHAAVERAVPQKETRLPMRELRVLYVDDEESLVTLAVRALRRMGYNVTGFTDPREALEAFRSTPEAFDIVVSDVSMPHLSGFDLAGQVQSVRPEIPIVFTSGYMQQADEELAAQLGVREIVLKPGSIEEIGHVLEKIFRESKQAAGPAAAQTK